MRWAAAATVVSVVAIAPVDHIAHRLSVAQRNGADWHYSVLVLALAAVIVAALALWTAAAVAAVRRMDLGTRLLAAESVLATALGTVMGLITAATALWWGSMASSAPWFLDGTRVGTPGSALGPNIVVAMALMLGASVVAGWGVVRITRSWPALRAG